jgi:hypothetical protein
MNYDVSIIMPAIRTPNWDRMYDSIVNSCKKYSFELIMCGPFALTEKLSKLDNVSMIIDNGCPSRCAQRAALAAKGKLIAHLVDDAIFIENSLDKSIDFYNTVCTNKDAVNLRYTEGQNYSTTPMHPEYWFAWHHTGLRLAGVPKNYKFACHHLIDTEYFKYLGGYDCSYEYQNYNLHDLMFRLQYAGGVLWDSPQEVTNCNHYPNGIVDHRAIEDAHFNHDEPLFRKMYSDQNVLQTRVRIPLDNWENTPKVWNRRFSKGIPKNYNEILKNNEV